MGVGSTLRSTVLNRKGGGRNFNQKTFDDQTESHCKVCGGRDRRNHSTTYGGRPDRD